MNDTALMVGQPTTENKVTINTAPAEAVDFGRFGEEIGKLDAEILRLVQHRTKISRGIGAARLATGGPRVVYKQDIAVLARFRELGPEGRDLAVVLLRLGRGWLVVGRNDLLSEINTTSAVHHTAATIPARV